MQRWHLLWKKAPLISILDNLSVAEVRVSHPLHTHRFSANVRVAITQKGHAEDKLAPINNKLMEKFHLTVQETKSSFDSQAHRGCYSCTQGSCTGTSPESIGRREVFSPSHVKGLLLLSWGRTASFSLPQTSLRSAQSSV